MEEKICKNRDGKWNGGYVGLIMLLVTFAIIALVIWKHDLLILNGDTKSNVKNGEVQGVPMESGKAAIDQAQSIKNMLESKDRQNLNQ
jgi:hypothetical protein